MLSPFIIEAKYCGYPIYAHGGILTTLIDEVMSHVINYQKKCYAVTSQITMQFLKPVYIGKPLLIVGKLLEEEKQNSKTIFRVHGAIYHGMDLSLTSPILAKGTAQWVKLSPAVLDHMKKNLSPF